VAPKNGKIGNTIKTMSFVLSFDTVHNNLGIDKVKEAIKFFLFTMKKRGSKQVGKLLSIREMHTAHGCKMPPSS
jgi:hypothetical protein